MSLFDEAYAQEGLAQKLKALGVPLDGTVVQPWGIGQDAIIDTATGNIIAFASSNVHGGTTITDTMNGVIGTTIPNSDGGESIMNDSFQQVAFTSENVFGGEHVYGPDMSLQTISFDTGVGESIYSSDMQLLGISPEHGPYIDMQANVTDMSSIFDSFSGHQSFVSYTDMVMPGFGSSLDAIDAVQSVDMLDGLDFLDWI
nr:hypothetical protein [Paenibacillus bovis]